MKYKNLILIGTSHIAKQSVDEVKNTILEKKPDIIALELDNKRLYALTHKKKNRMSISDIKKIGIKGYIFSLIGAFIEKKLGDYVGVAPGSEMLAAVNLAKKNNIKMALIDQDIEITLKRFSKMLSWKEKWNFMVDILKALFLKNKKKVNFDLRTVPSKEIIEKLIKEVKLRYPNIYKVLVEERNNIMAKNLSHLIVNNPDKKILGIIGAGHEEEIINLIKQKEDNAISYNIDIG